MIVERNETFDIIVHDFHVLEVVRSRASPYAMLLIFLCFHFATNSFTFGACNVIRIAKRTDNECEFILS